ncbi:hypothetical protein [Cohnella hongkongensis]|uniref:DUF4367 domain-containing protein n=1 Tax=Cohnella hongkongensis TaxID=178337 RepID=A0ABV9FA36_9BACL
MSTNEPFERQIKSIRIPEIDIRERVRKQLMTDNKSRTRAWKSKPTMLTAAALLIMILSGFASAAFIGLHNQNGQLIFSLKGYDDNNRAYSLPEEIVERFLQSIQPGEAIAIYSPAGNPDRHVSVQEKPIEIYEYEELKRRVPQHSFHLPSDLPDNVLFKSGVVHHLLGHPDIDRLIRQSEANGGEAVSEKVPVYQHQVQGVTLQFALEGNEYTAAMYEGSVWHTMYTDMSEIEGSRHIPVGQSEALLLMKEGKRELIWKSDKEQGDVFYRITANGQSTGSESHMVSLLELLLP